MKNRPILVTIFALSLLIDIILMILVYNKIGDERLPVHFGRLLFQTICIVLIITAKSNKALFTLTAYHIIIALITLSKPGLEFIQALFGIYHIVIGILIYFHDWFESKLKHEKNS